MIGQTLGHYRIESKLGAGGMGVVYKARDIYLDRTVALKVLPPDAVADPGRRQRFIQEAHAASAIDHPNIVTVYEISVAEGQHFIVMQYVAGKTLRCMLGPHGLPLNDALRYAIQLADALAQAHERGIVHRDLKPENVMVNERGQVKILDFGLAKLTEPVEPSADTLTAGAVGVLTEEGRIVGTAAYMSPEQAQGRRLDWRSDIFSFGTMLYEMVTGRQPFRGDNRLAVLSAIVRDEPERVTGITPTAPPELERAILRALRKDPERRFQHMDDLKVALQEIREESASATGQTGPMAASKLQPRSRRWVWAAALVAAMIIGGVVWFGPLRPAVEGPAPKTVALTGSPGDETDPDFSPDGKHVAFAWNGPKQDNFDIYVKQMDVDAATPFRLTTHPAPDFAPSWSPDGRYIAFYRSSNNKAEILVIPALGGPERSFGYSEIPWWRSRLSWSRDGKYLAIADKSVSRDLFSTFLLSIETGQRRRLTSPPAQWQGDAHPAFSPDGESLAFIRARSWEPGEIYVLPLANGNPKGEPKRLTFDERPLTSLAWMPDGRSIIFSSNRAGSQSLWKIAASGGQPQQLTIGLAGAHAPVVSLEPPGPQGQSKRQPPLRLAYVQELGEVNPILRIAAPRKGSADVAKPVPLIASRRLDIFPRYSPDGQKILFISERSGTREIWVCDSEGQNPNQVTSSGGAGLGSPRWSPDSRWILFDSVKAGQSDIYVVSAQSGSTRRLTTDSSAEIQPSWSRDGKWIYFGSDRSGDMQVWKTPLNPDGNLGPAVRVTQKGGSEAVESPDGRFIYYTKSGGSGLWRAPVSAGAAAEEVRVVDRALVGSWDITDDGIYLLNLSGTDPVIEFFSFATGRLNRVLTLPKEAVASLGTEYRFSVSPDARWFLYGSLHVQRGQTGRSIMLVDNFR